MIISIHIDSPFVRRLARLQTVYGEKLSTVAAGLVRAALEAELPPLQGLAVKGRPNGLAYDLKCAIVAAQPATPEEILSLVHVDSLTGASELLAMWISSGHVRIDTDRRIWIDPQPFPVKTPVPLLGREEVLNHLDVAITAALLADPVDTSA